MTELLFTELILVMIKLVSVITELFMTELALVMLKMMINCKMHLLQ